MKRYVVTDKYAEEKSLCSLHPENLRKYTTQNYCIQHKTIVYNIKLIYNIKLVYTTYNCYIQHKTII